MDRGVIEQCSNVIMRVQTSDVQLSKVHLRGVLIMMGGVIQQSPNEQIPGDRSPQEEIPCERSPQFQVSGVLKRGFQESRVFKRGFQVSRGHVSRVLRRRVSRVH